MQDTPVPHTFWVVILVSLGVLQTKQGAPDLAGAPLLFLFRCNLCYSWLIWVNEPTGGLPAVLSSICSLRYTSELMSYVASSNPCPCVMASVGQASTQ